MRLSETPDRVDYTSRRRAPGPRGAGGTVIVRPGQLVPPGDVTELEHFLTARWRLFSHSKGGQLRSADAQHPPWPLQRCQVERCEDSLVAAAGLPQPEGEPLAHYSRGVEVRIGLPRRVD